MSNIPCEVKKILCTFVAVVMLGSMAQVYAVAADVQPGFVQEQVGNGAATAETAELPLNAAAESGAELSAEPVEQPAAEATAETATAETATAETAVLQQLAPSVDSAMAAVATQESTIDFDAAESDNVAKIFIDASQLDEDITVVFTKVGRDIKKQAGFYNNDAFDFDLTSTVYDGFYLYKTDNTEYGNKTQPKASSEIAAAISKYGNPLVASIGDWVSLDQPRTLTFQKYTSNSDNSLNIPEGTFTRNPKIRYVNSTFYDYYSDDELGGTKRANETGSFAMAADGSRDKIQARELNAAIANYFKNTSVASNEGRIDTSVNKNTLQTPLYFGEFTGASTYENSLVNFLIFNNNGNNMKVDNKAGARQGLVNSKLVDNNLTMGTENTIAPYFNKDFLRGNNSEKTNLGFVFENVAFPFVKNTAGYWEFDSREESQTLRMKWDKTSQAYFLDRVGQNNAVCGFLPDDGGKSTSEPNFFPFNGVAESGNGKKLNYAFGVRMDIPFYMTDDGKVTSNEKSQDITYHFSGDDDVWIFIDGNLVLDIGGDHGRVEGQINFATNTATTTTINNTPGSPYKFTKLAADKPHTLTMFYMERGLWESNMEITYNFPQTNQLVVSKEVAVPTTVNKLFKDAVAALKTNAAFPVTIKNLVTSGGPVEQTIVSGFMQDDTSIADYGSCLAKTVQPIQNASYWQTGTESQQTVSADGKITLKDGQAVTFSNQFRRNSYLALAEECNSAIYDTSWTISEDNTVERSGTGLEVYDKGTGAANRTPESNTVGGKPPQNSLLFKSFLSGTDNTALNLEVKYKNTLKLGSITLKKALAPGETDNGEKYTFTVNFTNVAGAGGADVQQTVSLAAGEEKEIAGIPAGTTYTITETATDSTDLASIAHTGNDVDTDKKAIPEAPAAQSVTGVVQADATAATDCYTFTNKAKTTSLTITKVDAATSSRLAGVTFELEKLNGTTIEAAVDNSFAKQTQTTATDAAQGQCTFVPKISKETISKTIIGIWDKDRNPRQDAFNGISGTAALGDSILFSIQTTMPQYAASVKSTDILTPFTITDHSDPGIAMDVTSMHSKYYETSGSPLDFSVSVGTGKFSPSSDDGKTIYYTLTPADGKPESSYNSGFKITFDKQFMIEHAGEPVMVNVSGVLNDSAQLGQTGNHNTATIEYSNNYTTGGGATTQSDDVTVYTTGIAVKKVGPSPSDEPLPNASFALYKGSDDSGTLIGKQLSSNTGYLYFSDLSTGVYYLKEIKAPGGYTLAQGINFTIALKDNNFHNGLYYVYPGIGWSDTSYELNQEDDKEDVNHSNCYRILVRDEKGLELPGTGAMGAPMILAGGAGLVVLAGVLLLLYRKKHH